MYAIANPWCMGWYTSQGSSTGIYNSKGYKHGYGKLTHRPGGTQPEITSMTQLTGGRTLADLTSMHDLLKARPRGVAIR